MRGVLATFRGAVAEARANKSALWSQMGAMIANDVIWIVFWVIFFHRVQSIRGWDTSRVLLLLATLTTCAGLVLGVLANARMVGRMAAAGEMDALLALPVSPLPHLLVRRVDMTNVGDLAFGVCLFAAIGSPSLERTAIYVVGVLVGALLLTGFIVLLGSLAFFSGNSEAGDFGLQAMLLTASYPVDVFTGGAKALLYSVVPAAFIAAVPSSLVESFDGGTAATFVAVAFGFAIAAWVAFTLGLRRYSSGSIWTRA